MITLVMMPFSDIERPSLSLGLLKAALSREGLKTDVIYANLLFAKHAGIHASSLPLRIWSPSLIGEWVFAGAAFPDFSPSDDQYLEECLVPFARHYTDGDPTRLVRALKAELRRLRELAPLFIDRLARNLLAKKPKIVGCSSTFSQQVSSLVLLRRIRELAPDVITILGGANVEGIMGVATLETFPWIDAVCSGEADQTIVTLCNTLIKQGRARLEGKFPEGIITRHMANHAAQTIQYLSRSTITDLDTLPFPDYDDYFSSLDIFHEYDRVRFHHVLPMETSRGCWRSAEQKCTFCGLNRGRHVFQTKKPERALDEMMALTSRYKIKEFVMTDNVVPRSYINSLFPKLERLHAPYTIFYETRSGHNRKHARQFYAAGVRHLEAGIESLHDDLLKLMNKGTSVLENVALLKHAQEFGITVNWHFLTGFPGELDEWYDETSELLPMVHHLQPPVSLHGITLQRFSELNNNAIKYGLHPTPYNNYDIIYPLPSSTINKLAYYFRDTSWPVNFPEMNRETPGIRHLMSAVEMWKNEFHRPQPPQMTVRNHNARALTIILNGLAAEVYRQAEHPAHIATLPDLLSNKGINVSIEKLHEAIEELVAERLILKKSNHIVSLAVPETTLKIAAPPPERVMAEKAFHQYLAEIIQ